MWPIIDTHQHLWDLDRFRLPWTADVPTLARSFLPADYQQATDGLGIVRTIYMEVDVDPAQQQAEADYVRGLCAQRDNPMAAAVIAGRPASERFASYISLYRGDRYIKGVRQVLHRPETPPGYCLDEAFVAGIRLLGELGLSFDLCLRPGELADGARLAALCPHTRFVLDHCGNADVESDLSHWKRGLAAVARQPHVICKVSGIVVTARQGQWRADDLAPVVNHVLDEFGPQRVVFGGDWPVCTLRASYRQWLEALLEIVADRPESLVRALLHDNAVRYYGLA